MNDILNRIKGCLIGVAAGDAMGMPSSMMSPQKIKKTFGKIETFLPAPEEHLLHKGLKAAEITDDTQQTLLIADSIIAQREVDPEDIGKRLVAWCEKIGAFDNMLIGPSSLRALHAIRNGKSIYEAGNTGDTNGAVMRIAAVGIFCQGNLKQTVDAVEKACLPTHNTNIAIAGASGIAIAIGKGIMGEKNLTKIMPDVYEAIEIGMSRGVDWYSASIIKRLKLALGIVETSKSPEEAYRDLYEIIGAGVQIAETIPTCLAIANYVHANPVEGILASANLGGDCDTIGAITGAICGSIQGAKAFPTEWIEKLSAVNAIDFDSYAKNLYNVMHR
ncbi:MAG: ADP-ribosylglycohydrolase family protein [Candidatus Marinimicrobia bacterium]|nr:ADP-ribosylglycohydrolase family protein [Candidatus Neomarinimicrobiota bacterium]